MKRPKKHHFLPQSYLLGFTCPGKPTHVWQIEKGSAKNYLVAVRDAAQEADFHTVVGVDGTIDSSSVEAELSKIEAIHLRALRDVTQRDSVKQNVRRRVLEFVCVMRNRVPAFRDHVQLQLKRVGEIMLQNMARGDRLDKIVADPKLPFIQKYPPQVRAIMCEKMRQLVTDDLIDVSPSNSFVLQLMYETALDPKLISVLAMMEGEVLEAPPGAYFATCDQPVAVFNSSSGLEQGVGGLLHPDTEVSLPLTSQRLLWLRHAGSASTTFRYRTASSKEIAEFNRRIAIMASEYLFAPANDGGIVELASQNAQRFAGFKFTDTGTSADSTTIYSYNVPVRKADQYSS